MFRFYINSVTTLILLAACTAHAAPKVTYVVTKEGKNAPTFGEKPLVFELKGDGPMAVAVKEFDRTCEFRSAVKGRDPRSNPANTYILSCSNGQDRVQIGVGCFGEETRNISNVTFIAKDLHHQFSLSCN